jgi:hypothetical protein
MNPVLLFLGGGGISPSCGNNKNSGGANDTKDILSRKNGPKSPHYVGGKNNSEVTTFRP